MGKSAKLRLTSIGGARLPRRPPSSSGVFVMVSSSIWRGGIPRRLLATRWVLVEDFDGVIMPVTGVDTKLFCAERSEVLR
jgi:hypothetical protein